MILYVFRIQFKEMVSHDDLFEVEDGLILISKWANPCKCRARHGCCY